MNLIPFDTKKLRKGFFRMLIIGTSSSGKTVYFKRLFPNISDQFGAVCVFCPDGNNLQYKIMEKKYPKVAFSFCTATTVEGRKAGIDTVFRIRMETVHDVISGHQKWKKKVLVIFDDINDPAFINSQQMDRMFTSSRHQQISVAFLIQRVYKLVSPTMRNNSTHIVLFFSGNDFSTTKWVEEQVAADTRLGHLYGRDRKNAIRKLIVDHINFGQHKAIVCDRTNMTTYIA